MNLKNNLLLLSLLLITSCGPSALINSDFPSILTEDTRKQSSPINGFGHVVGKIESSEVENRTGLMLYLGDIFVDSSGFVGGFLDASKAPVADYNSVNGNFIFSDIKPGTYSLIIYEVVLGGKAYTDSEGNIVSIEVKDGEITDLGKIYIDEF